MPLFQPDVLRPSEHRLVIRTGTGQAGLALFGVLWFFGWWYAFLIPYRSSFSGLQWLWWLLMIVPAATMGASFRYFAGLFRRGGSEVVIDSMERTIARDGKVIAHFQDISKVVLHVFRPDRSQKDSSTARIQLAGGSKIDLARSFVPAQEKFVEQLTNDIAALLEKKVEIEYAGTRHLDSIKSLNLSRLDDEET
jgi:hypothetical protein